MTAKQRRRYALFQWRAQWFPEDPQQLSDSLSVEELDESGLPNDLVLALREFRKLRQDSRTAACRRFFEMRENERKTKQTG